MSREKENIDFDRFLAVDMRIGTVLEARLNPRAKVPAYVLRIDFGELGVKTSSAQITRNYAERDLTGRQVVAVVNFAPKRVAGVKSEVLVLGAVCESQGVVLLEPTRRVENGAPIG